MEEPEGITTFKGFALYDQVRFQYFKRFEFALNEYQDCLQVIANGRLPQSITTFVSRVCTLYIELSPKMEKINKPEITNALMNIEKYIATGDFKPINELKPEQFPNITAQNERQMAALFIEFGAYLYFIRQFLEVNGITEYEKAEYELYQKPIRALADD